MHSLYSDGSLYTDAHSVQGATLLAFTCRVSSPEEYAVCFVYLQRRKEISATLAKSYIVFTRRLLRGGSAHTGF